MALMRWLEGVAMKKSENGAVNNIPVVVVRWTTPRATQDEVTRPSYRPPDIWDDADTLEDEAYCGHC